MPRQSKKTTVTVQQKSRKLRKPTYQSLRLSKRIKHDGPTLTNSLQLLLKAVRLLKSHWRLFGSILLIYALLSVVFVRGFTGSANLPEIKSLYSEALGQEAESIDTGIALFGFLLGGTELASETTGLYQLLLLLTTSLALVWAMRQLQTEAKVKIRARDAFYKGMYPLIPVMLVLLVIALQLIPLLVGATVLNQVLVSSIAVTVLEKWLWALLFFCFALLSLYMISSSVFALYIASLPDMTPMQALRSGRELVRYRRWTVMRKVIFLPFVLLLLLAIITVPLILLLTPIAEPLFFVGSVLGLALFHSYMYTLYRELL